MHRFKQRAVFALLATALVSGLSLAPSPANAVEFSELAVRTTVDNTRSIGRCHFVVESYNSNTDVVSGRISAGVQAKNVFVGLGNKYNELQCNLYTAWGAPVASFTVSANSATIPQQNKKVEVPLSQGYYLCAGLHTLTGSGNNHFQSGCESSV